MLQNNSALVLKDTFNKGIFCIIIIIIIIKKTILKSFLCTAKTSLRNIFSLEPFFIDCSKTKTKFITLANHKGKSTIQGANQKSK